MDAARRIARSRITLFLLIWTFIGGTSGCTAWMGDYAPSEIWDRIAPSPETWEKFSPSNIWYNMSPTRLSKLNAGPGMSSDAYFSVSDPLNPAEQSDARTSQTRMSKVIAPVSDSSASPFTDGSSSEPSCESR